MLQLGKAELIADIKGDKAQRHIGKHRHTAQVLHGVEAQSGHAGRAQAEGAHQYAGDQKRRHVGKIEAQILEDTGHHQTGKQRKSRCQQNTHKTTSFFHGIFPGFLFCPKRI